MKTIILNWLATRGGAKLAPLILVGVGLLCSFVARKWPWLAVYVTPENVIAAVGMLLGLGMTIVNYLTSTRALKYSEPLQRLLNTISGKMGLRMIEEDGVIAAVSAAKADEIKAHMTKPGGPFNPVAEVRGGLAK